MALHVCENINEEFLSLYRTASLGHIAWATSNPFASINPTNPRTISWKFGTNCSAFGGGWKTQFFWVGHYDFFFKNKNFSVSNLLKLVTSLWDTKDGMKFWWLPWFPAKNNSCQLIWPSLYHPVLLYDDVGFHQVAGFLHKNTLKLFWQRLCGNVK